MEFFSGFEFRIISLKAFLGYTSTHYIFQEVPKYRFSKKLNFNY